MWRVGECFFEDKVGTKTIAFDGFHPNYTTVIFMGLRLIVNIRTKFCLSAPKPMASRSHRTVARSDRCSPSWRSKTYIWDNSVFRSVELVPNETELFVI